jgi:pyruvate/2-oxoglutarate/acetoin dehydrogenase E1 component
MQWGPSPLLICHDRSSARLRIALAKDDTAIIFGEDVAFGGVFRCTMVSLYFPQSKRTP